VLPFTGTSPLKAMQQALNGEGLPATAHVPDLPRGIDEMLRWMMQGDPRARPLSGHSLIAEIEALLDAPHDAQRVLRARQAHDRWRQREAAIAQGMRAVVGAVGAAVLSWIIFETLKLQPEGSQSPSAQLEWL